MTRVTILERDLTRLLCIERAARRALAALDFTSSGRRGDGHPRRTALEILAAAIDEPWECTGLTAHAGMVATGADASLPPEMLALALADGLRGGGAEVCHAP